MLVFHFQIGNLLNDTELEINKELGKYLILLYRSISNRSHILMHIKMKKLCKIQNNILFSKHCWLQLTRKNKTN